MPPSSGDAEHDREEACKGVTNCLGCEPPQDHGGSLSDGEGPYEPRESASDRLVRRAHATAHTTARRVHPSQDTIGGCERHDERNPKLGVALTKALVSPIRTWPDERRDERACPSLRNGRGDALPMRCRATATDQIMYGCRDHRFDMRSPCRDHDGLQIMVCSFSRPNHRTNTATRSGFGELPRASLRNRIPPCVVHSRSLSARPAARIIQLIS